MRLGLVYADRHSKQTGHTMALAYPPDTFAEILDFIVSAPSPEEIIAFKPSEQMEARLADLMAKMITDEEQAELM